MMISAMNEIASNRYVSAAAIAVILITALFIFSVSHTEVSVSDLKYGWMAVSSEGTESASLNRVNCAYEVSNDLGTNSTTIEGVVQESLTAFSGSTNLTYAMNFLYVAIESQYSVDVYKKASLTSEFPATIYESSDYYASGFLVLEEGYMHGSYSFNDTSPEQYTFTVEWTVTLTFINSTPLKAQFACNISFSFILPNLVQISVPNLLGYNALVAATIGIVAISMVFRAMNRPRLVDDSAAE